MINLIPPQYRLIAVAVVAALIFSSGWKVNGWRMENKLNQWKLDLAEAQEEARQVKEQLEKRSKQLSEANGARFAAEQAARDAEARATREEVIEYVQADYAGKCELPVDWVRQDVSSARGIPSDAVSISGADGAPSGFTDSDALRVVTDRNIICRNEIEKLKALQSYVKEQLQLFGG